MIIYVTEMLRWGDDESHHYIVGAFDNMDQAKECGEAEVSWRGGKYEYRVVLTELNYLQQEVIEYHKECTHG